MSKFAVLFDSDESDHGSDIDSENLKKDADSGGPQNHHPYPIGDISKIESIHEFVPAKKKQIKLQKVKKTQVFVFLCGIPGLGKDSVCNELLKLSHEFVSNWEFYSQDQFSHLPSKSDVKNALTFALQNALSSGKSVILKRNNHTVRDRADYIELARACNPFIKIVGIYPHELHPPLTHRSILLLQTACKGALDRLGSGGAGHETLTQVHIIPHVVSSFFKAFCPPLLGPEVNFLFSVSYIDTKSTHCHALTHTSTDKQYFQHLHQNQSHKENSRHLEQQLQHRSATLQPTTTCRFFGTPSGCRLGSKCMFHHLSSSPQSHSIKQTPSHALSEPFLSPVTIQPISFSPSFSRDREIGGDSDGDEEGEGDQDNRPKHKVRKDVRTEMIADFPNSKYMDQDDDFDQRGWAHTPSNPSNPHVWPALKSLPPPTDKSPHQLLVDDVVLPNEGVEVSDEVNNSETTEINQTPPLDHHFADADPENPSHTSTSSPQDGVSPSLKNDQLLFPLDHPPNLSPEEAPSDRPLNASETLELHEYLPFHSVTPTPTTTFPGLNSSSETEIRPYLSFIFPSPRHATMVFRNASSSFSRPSLPTDETQEWRELRRAKCDIAQDVYLILKLVGAV